MAVRFPDMPQPVDIEEEVAVISRYSLAAKHQISAEPKKSVRTKCFG